MAASCARPPLPANVERGVRALGERLRAAYGTRLAELRLFGSYARGEAHGESDVDVLVLFEDELSWQEQEALFLAVAEVDRAEGMWISPLVLSQRRLRQLVDDEIQLALDIEADGLTL